VKRTFLWTGTGLVGEYLRTLSGYKGEIDILDANMDILYVASKKPVNFRLVHFKIR